VQPPAKTSRGFLAGHGNILPQSPPEDAMPPATEADVRRQFPALALAFETVRERCAADGPEAVAAPWRYAATRESFVHFLCLLVDDDDARASLLGRMVHTGLITRKQALEISRSADGNRIPTPVRREGFLRAAAGLVSPSQIECASGEIARLCRPAGGPCGQTAGQDEPQGYALPGAMR
jgi:hypothetical protein